MLRRSVVLARTAIQARSVAALTANATRISMVPKLQPVKFYSTKDASKKEDKKQAPQSILTDDLLARAGFEDIDPKESSKANEQEGETEKETEGDNAETKEGSGARSSKKSRRRAQTSKDLQRERYANYFYFSTFAGGLLGLGYLSRDWDNEEERKAMEGQNIDNGYTPGLMYNRLNKRLASLFTFFSEPAFENLLPPPAPEAYRRPLTLVLTLDDLLIHSNWDTKNGWRTAKRPGLDYFLGYLSQYYEIVIFGSNYQMHSEKTVAKLDPMHAYISYALYREACRYKDGKLIKDLSLLNRDLGKTIIVDIEPECVSYQAENAIVVKPWDGKPDDYLIQLIPFLEYLATQPVKDVRPILNTFQDKSNIVEEFKERELKLRQKWAQDHKHSNLPNAGDAIGKLLGLPSVKKEQKMPLDIIREHGQFQYEQMQKYMRDNAQQFLEEEKRNKDQFGKVSLNQLITEGAPKPEDILKAQAERLQKEQEQQRAAK